MLRAVLFDLDDTLIDWSGLTGEWEAVVLSHARNAFDYICECHPLDNPDAYVREFRSRVHQSWMNARDSLVAPNLGKLLVEAAVALGVPPDRLDSRACMEAYRWGAVEGSRPFPEAPMVLNQLRESGIRLGIVTNAFEPMWVRDAELSAHGLSEFFPECRFSAADFGYLKPHPSIFRAAMDCLGTEPEETVFVGDDVEADIAGAKAAGVFAILRRTGRNRDFAHASTDADRVIDDLTELQGIFDDVFPGWNR